MEDIMEEEPYPMIDELMKIDDEILQKWYFEKNADNLIPTNKVSVLLKEFKL